MTEISFSIVLFNNSEKQVSKLIENLLHVTYKFEKINIYIINNSPNNIKLRNYLERYDSNKSIHVITSSKNDGFGSGHNKVLKFLNSKYHFVINPDVFIKDSEQIERMIDFMNQHDEYGLLSPLIEFPNGDVQMLLKHQPTVLDMWLRFTDLPGFDKRRNWFVNLPNGYENIHDAENVSGSFMMFRTSILEEINGFDEKYFLYMEDCDITRKVNQVSKTVFFPNAFIYHDWQRANKRSIHGIMNMIISMVKYFNKWGWKFH